MCVGVERLDEVWSEPAGSVHRWGMKWLGKVGIDGERHGRKCASEGIKEVGSGELSSGAER